MEVNGKFYPFWGDLVEKKEAFIGGTLVEYDMGMTGETVIEDIELEPNGEESAFFRIVGKDFNCGFDVRYGGIQAGEKGWLTFATQFGHVFKIQKEADNNGETIPES